MLKGLFGGKRRKAASKENKPQVLRNPKASLPALPGGVAVVSSSLKRKITCDGVPAIPCKSSKPRLLDGSAPRIPSKASKPSMLGKAGMQVTPTSRLAMEVDTADVDMMYQPVDKEDLEELVAARLKREEEEHKLAELSHQQREEIARQRREQFGPEIAPRPVESFPPGVHKQLVVPSLDDGPPPDIPDHLSIPKLSPAGRLDSFQFGKESANAPITTMGDKFGKDPEWVHSLMDREAAADMLLSHDVGAYLVRRKDTAGHFALSVLQDCGEVKHYMLACVGDYWRLTGTIVCPFDCTLEGVIEHLIDPFGSWRLDLKEAVGKHALDMD
eukprot:m.135755 g.135755  ORF g.135755 m.135755 type:complete len:329 (-) comp16961_c1_seq2:43-1029(-)